MWERNSASNIVNYYVTVIWFYDAASIRIYISYRVYIYNVSANSLRPRQNDRHFSDDIFKYIFLNENVGISIKISQQFVHKDPIDNNQFWFK